MPLPTASEVWFARLERACPIRKRWWNPEYRELLFGLSRLIEAVRAKNDWEWAAREEQRIWDAIGELYGIGPKPPDPGLITRAKDQLLGSDELRQASN